MKKVLVAGIVGLATAISSYAQGHVNISNYLVAPYNQVVWGVGAGGLTGQAVNDGAITLQIWYGAGVLTDASALLPGVTFTVDTVGASRNYTPDGGTAGPGGYYLAQTQVLPTTGVYTFQIRATGPGVNTELSRSILWQPTNIGSTALPAGLDSNSIGLTVVVPEPSSFALLGLGSAAMFLLRRKS